MTFQDIKEYYKTSYRFMKATGMSHSIYLHWKKGNIIPFATQLVLERQSNGVLKAVDNG